MTFLKLLGSLILKGLAIVTEFAPAVQQLIPNSAGVLSVVSKDLSEMYQVIANVEAVGQMQGLAGPDKAKAAAPLIAQIVLASAGMAGKQIADPALFDKACVEIAGGIADVLNSVHPVVATTSVAVPAAA